MSEIICSYRKIKRGHVDDVLRWMQTLMERKAEVLETFKDEAVRMEAAFVRQSGEDHFLIYIMEADNVDEAIRTAKNSTRPIDAFHCGARQRFTENPESLLPVFFLARED